jgi:hypothetical protein
MGGYMFIVRRLLFDLGALPILAVLLTIIAIDASSPGRLLPLIVLALALLSIALARWPQQSTVSVREARSVRERRS